MLSSPREALTNESPVVLGYSAVNQLHSHIAKSSSTLDDPDFSQGKLCWAKLTLPTLLQELFSMASCPLTSARPKSPHNQAALFLGRSRWQVRLGYDDYYPSVTCCSIQSFPPFCELLTSQDGSRASVKEWRARYAICRLIAHWVPGGCKVSHVNMYQDFLGMQMSPLAVGSGGEECQPRCYFWVSASSGIASSVY